MAVCVADFPISNLCIWCKRPVPYKETNNCTKAPEKKVNAKT